MIRQMLASSLLIISLVAGSSGDDKPAKTTPAKANFERMKKLAGTWVEAGKDGKPTDKVVSVIRVIAGGSAVHETVFPGEPQEMVSVYLLNGADLEMTHYCVLGNQPRMKADPNSPSNQIKFKFAGGTNLDPAKDMHMHEGTITFVDDDHYEVAGVAWVDGKPAEDHCGTMKFVRKK